VRRFEPQLPLLHLLHKSLHLHPQEVIRKKMLSRKREAAATIAAAAAVTDVGCSCGSSNSDRNCIAK
jgi:hypothetical protein